MAHRTQITLEDDQYARLQAEARRTGLGLAELVRRAVDHTYGATRPADVLRALDFSFGRWADRDYDGEQYVDNLRRGMSRRLTNQ